jgi:hypothetical protein
MSFVTPMPTVTPPSVASSMRAAAAAAPAPATPTAAASDSPSTTVTLSPAAQSMAASHASPAPSPSTTSTSAAAPAAPAPHESSIYDSIKNGLEEAVSDVGDAIAGGAHAVVEGVETTLSTIHDVAKGTLELPFAVVAKACDAVGSLIEAV